MMRHLPRSPAVMKLAAMLLLPLIAVHPAVGQQLFSEAEIRPLVEGLHNGTLAPATASANCKQRVEQDEGGNDIRQFMSTYLEVPEAQAVADFCDALVRAINADTVSAEGLILIAREQKDAEGFHEFGRLLRAVYFAHRLTPTAGAEEGKLR